MSWRKCRMVWPLWKRLAISYELTFTMQYPVLTVLGIYPTDLKTVFTKTCTWMFIAPLFTSTQNRKQSRRPSICEWINKPRGIHTMEYHPAIKGNELPSPEKTWWKLKIRLISERRQSGKAVICFISSIWHFWKEQNYSAIKKKITVTRSLG